MNIQDQQAIEGLFRHMAQTAQQNGPRDPQAEALIEQHIRQAPPGILYHMAQTIIAQQHAITQLRARAGGAPAGFGQPTYTPQPGYGQPVYAQNPSFQQRHGFLAGAGKIALGVGGGVLAAEAANSIFHGVENMFDGGGQREEMYQEQQFADQQYDQGYQQGLDAGEQRDMGQFGGGPQYDNVQYDNVQQFDQGQPFDQGQQFDQGGYDQGGFDQGFDQGGFDDGGFDNGGGFL